jgi:hypothetical protein
VGGGRGLAVASDGTIYFPERDRNRVWKVTPEGVLVLVAGSTAGFGGDGGLATAAQLRWPSALVVDEARDALYVSDAANRRIRKIDLATGIITTIAGGGTQTAPPYGDGGPAADATIGTVNHMSLGPDGNLYLGDPTAKRLRKVNLATGTITSDTPEPAGSFCNGVPAGQYRIFSCGNDGSECSSTWDAQGNLYLAANWCAPGFSGTTRNAVMKRDTNGVWSHVAGGPSTGSTADGTLATDTYLAHMPHLQIGPDGALYLQIAGAHVVRRIDPATSAIHTVAGTFGVSGDGTDYSAATSSLLSHPTGFGFTPDGHLVIHDYVNGRVHRVW